MLNRLFGLADHGTTVRREVAAGLTTFLTMSYIIFVNPLILSDAGMPRDAVVTATILAAAFGTLLAGLWANVPYAMAPGMGLNAFFTYTLVLGQGIPWQTALGAVFFSGLLFFILTVVGVRERIVQAIPVSLRLSLAAGIGLFITFIGCQGMGLVVANPATLVGLGTFDAPVLLGLLGLVLMTVMEVRKVPGAILLGLVAVMGLSAVLGFTPLPTTYVSTPPSLAPVFCQLDFVGAMHVGMVGAVFSMMFVDLFDSVGTIVACSYEAGLVREDGTIEKLDRVLTADALATMAGAVLGTSTTTTYIESGSGIAAGGRTGLSSVVTSGMFLLALFLTPVILMVPKFATAPALIIVGVHMFRSIRKIDFSDFEVAVPAFLAIVTMPLTYSISTGLAFGFLSYIVIAVSAGDIRKIRPTMWVIGALALLELLVRTGIGARLFAALAGE